MQRRIKSRLRYSKSMARCMELKATSMGKRLAQHPYHQIRMLAAGVEVLGDHHEYIIPFNQLLAVECKRGLVWGELEFQLVENKVVRLHGTEWQETQQFWQYLSKSWQTWSQQMAAICSEVLIGLQAHILAITDKEGWLSATDMAELHQEIGQKFAALPLPIERLKEFPSCFPLWQFCAAWLASSDAQREQRNQRWLTDMQQRFAEFFATIESSPLNDSQSQAVINGEKSVLVLAGAGSGKTSVLVARTAWLLLQQLAHPEQVLLLAFGRDAATELNQRITQRTGETKVVAKTFHALALSIIRQATNKEPKITDLEFDTEKRQALFIETWATQCAQHKTMAKGWRQLIIDELQWTLPEGEFWQDDQLRRRMATELDNWVSLIRQHGGNQTTMCEAASEADRPLFSKYIKLLSPLVKAWKAALKEQGALDFASLIEQACSLIEKGRFISPWKHILVDEFQDISPQRAKLIRLLCHQNCHSHLFAVGDDWQAIYRFAGADLDLTTRFHQNFGQGASCFLDTTYRFDQQLGTLANRFIQANPQQLAKKLNSLHKGDKKSVRLLAETQLEALLDKMSGYVETSEKILILARYRYAQPAALKKAATRWPNLQIEFMTMHASKGREADYVIVIGLSDERDGFPAHCKETLIERTLLATPEDFPYAEERRLAYVAMTRARKQLWLLYNTQQPSPFVAELKQLGVKSVNKP